MTITKKLIHFNQFSNFNTQKLSVNHENTAYTIGIDGTVTTGEPYILYQSIVFIKDVLKIWTHGSLYDCGSVDLSNYLTADEIAEVYATIEDISGKLDSEEAATTYATINSIKGKQDASLKFTDMAAAVWVSDPTYEEFPYRCDLVCNGVRGDMYAEVSFAMEQATSGDYAPICETKTGIVSIWSKSDTEITVPTIIITSLGGTYNPEGSEPAPSVREIAICNSEPTSDDVQLWVDTSVETEDEGSGDGGSDTPGGVLPEDGYEVLSVSVKVVNADSVTARLRVNNKDVEITSGSNYSEKIAYGTEYTIQPYEVEGFTVPEVLTFIAGQEIRIVELEYLAPIITTININQNISDPYSMVTMVSDGGAIQKIRENSHRYVGNYDSTNKRMVIRQLDDNNGTLYKNGIPAPITQLGNDVFMKLPKFWYKAEEIIAEGIGTDSWNISFAFYAAPNSTWKEWDGKEMIGVYKATINDERMYSYSTGEIATILQRMTDEAVKETAHNRGEGYSLVKWKHHCIMAFLYYAYYLNTDSVSTIGQGHVVDPHLSVIGDMNEMGMTDTRNGTKGTSLNFWGLENWWGGNPELFENVSSLSSENVITITEDDGETRDMTLFSNSYYNILKISIGEYLDVFPTEKADSSAMGYCCDCASMNKSDTAVWYPTRAKGQYTFGIISLSGDVMYVNGNGFALYTGTRLCYHGDYVIDE